MDRFVSNRKTSICLDSIVFLLIFVIKDVFCKNLLVFRVIRLVLIAFVMLQENVIPDGE